MNSKHVQPERIKGIDINELQAQLDALEARVDALSDWQDMEHDRFIDRVNERLINGQYDDSEVQEVFYVVGSALSELLDEESDLRGFVRREFGFKMTDAQVKLAIQAFDVEATE